MDIGLTGVEALALSKKYTADTAEEFGALKGAPCEIQSIVDNGDGTHTITYEWTNSQGETRTDTLILADGKDGKDGKDAQYSIMPSASASNVNQIVQYSGATTQNYTNGYFYQCVEKNGSYKWVPKNVQAGGSGGSAVLSADLVASVTVGGVTSGDEYYEGDTLETVIRDILSPTLYPTFAAPSATISATGNKLLEIGATADVEFTITFNRGSITPAYGTNGYRSGVAEEYTLDDTTQSSNVFERTITSEKLSYQGSVSYAAGEQPKDSKGNDYDSPLAAGTVNTNIITYEFVNALWANTADITTVAKLALVSKTAKQKEFTFPSATVANPEVFDVPSSWTINALEVLNTLNNQWENCSTEFTTSSVSHDDAGGTSTAYTRYTCNLGYAMGSRKIRIKWS